MKQIELGWVAGMLEGDGSFALSATGPNTTCIRVEVVTTDKDITTRLTKYCGGYINGPYEQRGPFGKKPIWRWRLNKKADVTKLLQQVRPLMGKRRKQQIDRCLKGTL